MAPFVFFLTMVYDAFSVQKMKTLKAQVVILTCECGCQAYMEDHVLHSDRLGSEWDALCGYEAELGSTTEARLPHNLRKNRSLDVLPCNSFEPFMRNVVSSLKSLM